LKFLLDENVPISIKKVIQDKGFKLRKIVDSFLKKYSLKLNNSFKLTLTETDEVYEPL